MNQRIAGRLVFVFFFLAFLSSCATGPPPVPEFNQTFLKNTTPNNPAGRVELPEEIANKLSEVGCKGLHWISDDNMVILLPERQCIMVIPSTGEVFPLEGGERDTVVSQLYDRVDVTRTNTKAGAIVKAIFAMISETSESLDFQGNVKDENTKAKIGLHILFKYKKSGSGWFTTYNCVGSSIDFSLKDENTGAIISTSWPSSCYWRQDKFAQEKVIELLMGLRSSPDRKYFLFQNNLYDVSAGSAEEGIVLFKNYDYMYTTVNPNWEKIAILRKEGKRGEKVRYWVEFHPISM